jgi:hypothetical protein
MSAIRRDRLYLVNLRRRRNPLNHDEDRQRLAGLLRTHNVESLIIDPFGRAYTGKSENDSGEVGAWLADLDRFPRGDAGVSDLILSAHAGWDGERTRGASALEDWADSIITLAVGKDDGDELTRYLRAEGRDVLVEEDRLNYDPQTRPLTMAGVGSRKTAARTRHLTGLIPALIEAVNRNPARPATSSVTYSATRTCRSRRATQTKAANLAVEQGLLTLEQGSRGANNYFPSPPPRPPLTPQREVKRPPLSPS